MSQETEPTAFEAAMQKALTEGEPGKEIKRKAKPVKQVAPPIPAVRKPTDEYRRQESNRDAVSLQARQLGQRWMAFVGTGASDGKVRRNIIRDTRPLYAEMQSMDEPSRTLVIRELSYGMSISSRVITDGMRHYLKGKEDKIGFRELTSIHDLVPSAAFFVVSIEDMFELSRKGTQSLHTYINHIAKTQPFTPTPLEPMLSRWMGQTARTQKS